MSVLDLSLIEESFQLFMREMWAVTKAEEARIDLFHSEYIDKNGKKKMKVDEDLRD